MMSPTLTLILIYLKNSSMLANNIEIELELTYLARRFPKEIAGVNPKRLLDIYVPENDPRPYIRLRQKANTYEVTKKKPINDNDYSEQLEQTISLDAPEFEELVGTNLRRFNYRPL